jgi:hypothetical protein
MTAAATGTTSLVDVLRNIGVEVTNVGEREIGGRCPVHITRTGKADGSPSWSMNATTGAWICFSCGARGSLMGLVQELTGSDQPAYDYYSTVVTMGLERLTTPQVSYKQEPDVIQYHKYEDAPDSEITKRSLTSEACRLHGVRWDSKNEAWIIPLLTRDRSLIGWQAKKSGWVRNYPIGVKKSSTLFGIERFKGGTAVLVESPLDVVRLTSLGLQVQGLASFGAAVSDTQVQLLEQYADKVIVAMDNDEAGIASSKKLFSTLPRFRKGILWLSYDGTTAKDIGDMTDDQIVTAISSASAIPKWFK